MVNQILVGTTWGNCCICWICCCCGCCYCCCVCCCCYCLDTLVIYPILALWQSKYRLKHCGICFNLKTKWCIFYLRHQFWPKNIIFWTCIITIYMYIITTGTYIITNRDIIASEDLHYHIQGPLLLRRNNKNKIITRLITMRSKPDYDEFVLL